MAKIQINVDTETKELIVSINGTVIPNIEDANVYSYRDSNGNVDSLSVDLRAATQTVDDVRVNVNYYASGSEKAKSAIASKQKVYTDVEGFVGVDDTTQLNKDVSDFLSTRKRSL